MKTENIKREKCPECNTLNEIPPRDGTGNRITKCAGCKALLRAYVPIFKITLTGWQFGIVTEEDL